MILAGALEKILDDDAKEKLRNDEDNIGRLISNDDTRDALAQRLEALADRWEAAKGNGGN